MGKYVIYVYGVEDELVEDVYNPTLQYAKAEFELDRNFDVTYDSWLGNWTVPRGESSDVWVIDSSSLGMVYLQDRQLHSEPATAPGYDGQKWTILGEFTFEFKNAKQKICRVKNLKDSAAALS